MLLDLSHLPAPVDRRLEGSFQYLLSLYDEVVWNFFRRLFCNYGSYVNGFLFCRGLKVCRWLTFLAVSRGLGSFGEGEVGLALRWCLREMAGGGSVWVKEESGIMWWCGGLSGGGFGDWD